MHEVCRRRVKGFTMMRLAVASAFILIVGCVLGSGCSPAYRDPMTGVEARYEWETLRSELDRPISIVFPAARDAAAELDLRLLRCDLDGIAGEVVALDAHLDTVNIRLEGLLESRTLLTIQVGLFGNKNKSLVVFEEILAYLERSDGAFSKDLRFGREQLP